MDENNSQSDENEREILNSFRFTVVETLTL